ncbi:MAG: DUF1015 family protein [Erysipelotrichaceae bacterium]|nr:DUF1015 family protein [Erysipelotrichaceae bacterium]
MKLLKLNESFLNVSGNIYEPDFLNLAYIENDRLNFDDRVMFLSEKQKDKLNQDKIKKYQDVVYIVKYHDKLSLLADLDIKEYKEGNVKAHELVIPDTIQGMLGNFRGYNTEVAPVLLLYKDKISLKECIQTIAYDDYYEVNNYQVYVYQNHNAEYILKKYEDIKTLYVADGHHRLYSTSMFKKKNSMLACIMNFDDIIIYPIHRIIRNMDAYKFEIAKNLFEKKQMISSEEHIDKGIVKITYKNEVIYTKLINIMDDEFWNNDILRLNTQIFTTAFRINDYSEVSFLSGIDFERKNYILGKNDVLLEVYPISKDEFVNFSDMNFVMPPKSTCFEPKFPSFLIMKKYK